ncbi:MAG: hypothetical protein GX455_15185 [Phycisphaerae bacterium]|nr:hypothetical protein [Phycisphaerae bacterium]
MRRIPTIALFLVGLLVLLAVVPASAVNWRITQITDNEGDDSSTRVISQGWLAWVSKPSFFDDQEIVLYYPGPNPIRQITNNDYDDNSPDLSWNPVSEIPTLCWKGRCGPDNTYEIFTMGFKVPLRLTDNSYEDDEPQNSGTHIVWEGRQNGDDWEIFRYTSSLGVVQLTMDSLDDRHPVVSGLRILWSKTDPEEYGQETYYFDGLDTFRLTDNAWMERDHRIDGMHQVWGMFHGSGVVGDWEIHHRYSDGPIEQLTNNTLYDFDPVVSGNRIVWTQNDGHDTEILYYDGVSIRQLTDNEVDDEEPQISGQRIVWVRYPRTGELSDDGQIYLFDDADDSITLLEDGYDNGYHPKIAGNFVVWHVFDGHDYEVMLAIACDEMPGDIDKNCVVDLADFAILSADWLDCTLPSVYCP